MKEFNLCSILSKEMRRLQFHPLSVASVENNPDFKRAEKEEPVTQRMMLTMLLNKIFVMGPYVVPANIRIALSIASDAKGWSDDLKLVLLPFLKENEVAFFPSHE